MWVTGAGSGMGRAAAVALAGLGAHVVLSGRRAEALVETADLVSQVGGRSLVVPFDVTDPGAAGSARAEIGEQLGAVSDLVLSAGLNARARTWADQSLGAFEAILATNLTGVAAVIDAALPDLRAAGTRRRGGQVVVISSYAGWRFTPYAGVAYSASKTALGSICAGLNAQEAAAGVRACHLCPGDVATDFLQLRPNAPDAAARSVMLSPEDVAAAITFVLASPAHVRIDELVLSPLSQT